MTDRPTDPVLPDGIDDDEYRRIRGLMRVTVLRVWRSEHVIAGTDPWGVVDEAWGSMAENGFRSKGPFLPFALRVARNKAVDALSRAEAKRRDRSLQEPLSRAGGPADPLAVEDVTAGSSGADDDYFSKVDHLETVRRLALAEEAIYVVLTDQERDVFLAVRVAGKSRASVGRDLDPPLTGQRIGQIVASATMKIRTYVDEHDEGTEA